MSVDPGITRSQDGGLIEMRNISGIRAQSLERLVDCVAKRCAEKGSCSIDEITEMVAHQLSVEEILRSYCRYRRSDAAERYDDGERISDEEVKRLWALGVSFFASKFASNRSLRGRSGPLCYDGSTRLMRLRNSGEGGMNNTGRRPTPKPAVVLDAMRPGVAYTVAEIGKAIGFVGGNKERCRVRSLILGLIDKGSVTKVCEVVVAQYVICTGVSVDLVRLRTESSRFVLSMLANGPMTSIAIYEAQPEPRLFTIRKINSVLNNLRNRGRVCLVGDGPSPMRFMRSVSGDL